MRTLALIATLLLPFAARAQLAFDAERLPAVHGRVAHYSLTPNGDVDGLILDDGTEIHLPPHLGPQLVRAVPTGATVVAYGLRARAVPVMDAVAIKNLATGATVDDHRLPDATPGPPPPTARREIAVAGTVKLALHGPKGDLNGALLDDGTIVRLPPGDARGLADALRPGRPIAAAGSGVDGPTGRVVAADRIGPDLARLRPLSRDADPRR